MNKECKNCIKIFSLVTAFIVFECPHPFRECKIKEKWHHVHDHVQLTSGPPTVSFATFVTGSTNEIVQSSQIKNVKKDPDRLGYHIYKTGVL